MSQSNEPVEVPCALEPAVVDAIWASFAAYLPERGGIEHPLGCHRPRISERECFEAILFRLVTGCSWDVAGRLGKGSETTLRRRRDEWVALGAYGRLVEEAICAFDKVIGLDLSDVSLDGSLHKAPCGGEGTGPNPTVRAKTGWKWSVATDTNEVPIGWVIDGANRNDSILLAPTLDDIAERGLLCDIETIWLDRGYDSAITLTRLAERPPRRRHHRQETQEGVRPRHDGPAHGPALARRAHQLMAEQLRSAEEEHRSIQLPPPGPVRPGRGPHHHRQARQMGQALGRPGRGLMARALNATGIGSKGVAPRSSGVSGPLLSSPKSDHHYANERFAGRRRPGDQCVEVQPRSPRLTSRRESRSMRRHTFPSDNLSATPILASKRFSLRRLGSR